MGEIIWLNDHESHLGFSALVGLALAVLLGLFCIRTRIQESVSRKITRKFVRRARPAEVRLKCKVFIRVFANLLLANKILRFESTKENLA